MLVLYCDRNINKDKLRECMEGSKWTEYAKKLDKLDKSYGKGYIDSPS